MKAHTFVYLKAHPRILDRIILGIYGGIGLVATVRDSLVPSPIHPVLVSPFAIGFAVVYFALLVPALMSKKWALYLWAVWISLDFLSAIYQVATGHRGWSIFVLVEYGLVSAYLVWRLTTLDRWDGRADALEEHVR